MRIRKPLSLLLALAMIIACVPVTFASASADTPTYKFDFGSETSPVADGYTKITPASVYDAEAGFGWQNDSRVTIEAVDDATGDSLRSDYIKGNNERVAVSNNTSNYYCPTFVVDVPNGVYEVRVIRGAQTMDVCSGAYIEENFNAIPWFSDALPNTYTAEPTALITAPAGTYLDDTATVVVWDGQLTIEIAASMTAAGVSGVAVVNAIEITKLAVSTEPADVPNVYIVGDSTTATYPPFTNPSLSPIPEQTGWGAVFGRFFTDDVNVENWALGGMSAKNYLTEGFWNMVLLKVKPGDIVFIEWGINESASGRRYIANSDEYEAWMRRYTNAVKSLGATPVLVTAFKTGAYVSRILNVAEDEGVELINVNSLYSAYIATRGAYSGTGYFTIDGTHPSRIGGIVLAQLTALELKSIDHPVNQYNIVKPITSAAPTYIPENFRVTAQTAGTVSFAWDCPDEVIYDTEQLIFRFPIYRREAGSTSEPAKYAEGTAYVNAGMEGPKLSLTVEHSGGDYEYFIAVTGINGTGEMSEPVAVGTYVETSADVIGNLLSFYKKANRYDYTYVSFEAFKAAAEAAMALEDPNEEDLAAAAYNLRQAYNSLTRVMSTYLFDDFQGAFDANWGTSGSSGAPGINRVLEDDGNRYINFYVSASGARNRTKTFSGYPSSSKTAVQFEWYTNTPDSRNVCELRFHSGSNTGNSLFFGLKASSNGHIGYFADSTGPNVRGDGFHEASNAVDLGLPADMWYLVSVEFDFANKTACLSIMPRNLEDRETIDTVVIENITLPDTAATLYSMQFYGARGQNDSGGNDLSLLWNTSIDNYGIYYLAPDYSVDTGALAAALANAAGYDESAYTAGSYAVLASAVETAELILSYPNIAQSDVNYAVGLIGAAIEQLVEDQGVSLNVSVGTPTIAAKLSAYLSISIVDADPAYGPYTAYLAVGDELLYATEIVNGRCRMYIQAAPEDAGEYKIVVKGNGAEGSCGIEVLPYSNSVWSATAFEGEDGLLKIKFNASIGGKTGFAQSISIGDAVYDATLIDKDTLAVAVAYDSLDTGTVVTVKGVILTQLFPSYMFTYKVTIS